MEFEFMDDRKFKDDCVWKFMNAAYIEECNGKVAPRFDQYVTAKMIQDEMDLDNLIALELRILDAQVADGTMTVAQRIIREMNIQTEEAKGRMKNKDLLHRYEMDFFNRESQYKRDKHKIEENWSKCLKVWNSALGVICQKRTQVFTDVNNYTGAIAALDEFFMGKGTHDNAYIIS